MVQLKLKQTKNKTPEEYTLTNLAYSSLIWQLSAIPSGKKLSLLNKQQIIKLSGFLLCLVSQLLHRGKNHNRETPVSQKKITVERI